MYPKKGILKGRQDMKECKPPLSSEGIKSTSMIASQQQENPARFGIDQDLKSTLVSPNHDRNELDFLDHQPEKIMKNINFIEESIRLHEDFNERPYPLRQLNARDISLFNGCRNAVIQIFLVVCVALVFFTWTAVGLYEQWSTGNCSLLLGDAAPATLFIMVVHHFLLEKKE